MEFVGLAFTVTSAASRASTGIWGLTREWKHAPRELHNLKEDISRIEQFFDETWKGIEAASERLRPQSKAAQRQVEQLQRLLQNGRELLVELESIFQQIRGQQETATEERRSDDLRKRRRIVWFAKKGRVDMIQRRIKDITLETCGTLIALNMSVSTEYYHSITSSYAHIISHLESRLSGIQDQIASKSTAQENQPLKVQGSLMDVRDPSQDSEMARTSRRPGRPYEQFWATTASCATGAKSLLADGNPWATFISGTSSYCRVGPSCDFDCDCRCHSTRSYTAWEMRYLSSFAGTVVLSYFGSSRWNDTCDRTHCMNRTNPPKCIRLTYSLPAWLTNATIFMGYGNLTGRPEFLIRVSNTIPMSTRQASNDLLTAVCQGRIDDVKSLLRTRNCSVYDTLETCQQTALYFAIVYERLDVVELLLQAGSDPSQVNALGQSPIRKAFSNYIARPFDPEVARYATLFNFEALLDEDEFSRLQRTILGFMPGNVGELLTNPRVADEVNHKNSMQNTALHLAAMQGDVNTIRMLLRAGSEIDSQNSVGRTPLHEACIAGSYGAAKALLEAGASIHIRENAMRTALHLAAGRPGAVRTMRLLFRFGADIRAVDKGGCTAASYAAGFADVDSLKLLLDEGIDINHRDLHGDTLIFDAMTNGHHGFMAALLRHGGISLTCANEYRRTILHVLAGSGDAEMMRLFAGADLRGLDTNAKDMHGKTPLQIFNERLHAQKEIREAFGDLLDAVEAASRPAEWDDTDDEDDGWFDCIDSKI